MTIAPAGAYCHEIELSPCWETSNTIMKVLDFFSFLIKLDSGLVCTKELFKKMEATTCHLKDGSHKFPTLTSIVQYKSLQTWRK
jgi:hypothetical protein